MKSVALAVTMLAGTVPAYNLYWANLHSHTGYSDGTSVPRHAFAYARDTAHIQVLGITDHAELIDPYEWWDTGLQADSATRPGSFVGLAGFEWTSVYLGHVGVLFTTDMTSVFTSPSMPDLYRWLYGRPSAVGQFNHPGDSSFDRFACSDTGDARMALFEMLDSLQADRYHIALDSGWHVGFVASQDNHDADWGAGHRLAGIWADSLEPGSIREALAAMRTFGTGDRNLALRMFANGAWMGATVENGLVRFRVEAADVDTLDFFSRLDLVSNGGVVVESLLLGNSSHVAWECSTVTQLGEHRYFFCRAIQNDRDRALCSAVWTQDPSGLETAESQQGRPLLVAPNPFRVCARVKGREAESFTVYDAVGTAVETCPGNRIGAGLPAGVYFLKPPGSPGLRLVKLH